MSDGVWVKEESARTFADHEVQAEEDQVAGHGDPLGRRVKGTARTRDGELTQMRDIIVVTLRPLSPWLEGAEENTFSSPSRHTSLDRVQHQGVDDAVQTDREEYAQIQSG